MVTTPQLTKEEQVDLILDALSDVEWCFITRYYQGNNLNKWVRFREADIHLFPSTHESDNGGPDDQFCTACGYFFSFNKPSKINHLDMEWLCMPLSKVKDMQRQSAPVEICCYCLRWYLKHQKRIPGFIMSDQGIVIKAPKDDIVGVQERSTV